MSSVVGPVLRLVLGSLAGLVFLVFVGPVAQRFGVGFDAGWWRYAALASGLITLWGTGKLWQAPEAQRALALFFRVTAFLSLVAVLMQPVKTSFIPAKRKLLVLLDQSPSVAAEARQPPGTSDKSSWPARLRRLSETFDEDEEMVIVPFFGSRATTSALALPDSWAPDLGPILDMIPSMVGLDEVTTVLLLTDGGHAGAPLHVSLSRLRRAGVRVVQGRLPSRLDEGDIAVTGISLPSHIAAGSRIEVLARVGVERGMDARCTLQIDGAEVASARVEDGEARFQRVRVGEEIALLTVECLRADGLPDAVPGNHSIQSYLVPERRPRVLVVDRSPAAAQVLVRALGDGFEVEVRGPGGVPRKISEWRKFDTVLVSDLPRVWNQRRNLFSSRQMAQAEQFVQEGGGFVMVGGPQALGPGGYTGTPLEQTTLPVWLDTPRVHEKPQLALVLVLDRSGSMSGVKLDLAKEAAAATVETLARDDRIGVVVFDAKPEIVVRLQRASNRFRILDDIAHVGAGGGTSIRPALAEAFRMLRKNEARFRHVILLTDGQSPRDSILETVQSMTEAGITVSTVAVGRQADRVLLRNMAEAGSGRYHFTDSPRNIPRIFLSETRELRQQTADVERFQPRITPAGRRVRYLRKYAQGMGQLDGMVLVRPKPEATVLLVGAEGKALLVRGARGKGSVHIFSSDLKGIWTNSWLRSTTYAHFWRGFIRSTLPTFDESPDLQLRDSGEAIRIQVQFPMDGADGNAPEVVLRKAGAEVGASRVRVSMAPDAPGVFAGVFRVDGPGAFLVEVHTDLENPRAPVVRQVISRPYDQELNPVVLAAGRAHLNALHESGLLRKVDVNDLNDLWSPTSAKKEQRTELWDKALMLFLALWLLGLSARRITIHHQIWDSPVNSGL